MGLEMSSALREMQDGLRMQGEPRRQAVAKSISAAGKLSRVTCEESQLMAETKRMSMIGPTLAKTSPWDSQRHKPKTKVSINSEKDTVADRKHARPHS